MFYRLCHTCFTKKKFLFISTIYNSHTFTSHFHRSNNVYNIFRKSYFSDIRIQFRNFSKLSNSVPKKTHQREFRRLLKLAGTQKWKLSGAVFLLCISSAVTMAVPFCVGKLIDRMTNKEDLKSSLASFCKILISIFIVGALANFGRVYLMNMASYQLTNNLRNRIYSSILCQEAAFFDRTKTGELINRLSTDTSTVGVALSNNVSDGLRNSIMFLASSCLMVYTSPTLASISLAIVTPVGIAAALSANILKRISKDVQDALADSAEVADERISNIRIVQAFAKYAEESENYESKIKNVLHFASKQSFGRAIFFGMTGLSGNLIILSVLYYGGSMVSANQITVGSLSSFLLYAAYVGVSIAGLSTFYTELMRGLGASTRMWELIDRKPLIPLQGGLTFPTFHGNVRFEGISFSYPSRPNSIILSDFYLNVPAGTVCAIVGASGCGKSTVGSLLLRLYDSQEGSVTIDGHDIKSLNISWLRKNIGIVYQDPVLFSFSIRENILYGIENRNDISDSLLEDTLVKANVKGFVDNFPDGLDTVVGERGVMLSGGQRQRIAIARALLKNPKILILDEATSALDAHSEFLVHRALEELMTDRTVITIAHRLSTVRKADVIAVLEAGHVVQQGKYENLMAQEGPFKRLVQLQNLKQR